MFKIEGTKIQGCCYCDKGKLVNINKDNYQKRNVKRIDDNLIQIKIYLLNLMIIRINMKRTRSNAKKYKIIIFLLTLNMELLMNQ